MRRLEKKGSGLPLEMVIVLLLLLGVAIWFFVFWLPKMTQGAEPFDETLKQLKASKIKLGDLTQEETNNLKSTAEGYELYLNRIMQDIEEGIAKAKELNGGGRLQDAVSLLNNKLNLTKSAAEEINNDESKKYKYIDQRIALGNKQEEIKKLIQSMQSQEIIAGLKNADENSLKVAISDNPGTLLAAEARKELFFKINTEALMPNLVLTFRDSQMNAVDQISDTAQKAKLKAEVEYTIGLILEDAQCNNVCFASSSNRNDTIITQFRKLLTNPSQYPFTPMAKYKLAKLEQNKTEAFKQLQEFWNENKDDAIIFTREINEDFIENYIKKGYSEYFVSLELHAVVEDDDAGAEECTEVCSTIGEPFSNGQKYCLDKHPAPLEISFDNGPKSKNAVLKINNIKYKKSTEQLPFSVSGCSVEPISDGKSEEDITGIREDAPTWMEYKVVDKLTEKVICETTRASNPQSDFLTYEEIDQPNTDYPASSGCNNFVKSTFSEANLNTGFLTDSDNTPETVTVKVELQFCPQQS